MRQKRDPLRGNLSTKLSLAEYLMSISERSDKRYEEIISAEIDMSPS